MIVEPYAFWMNANLIGLQFKDVAVCYFGATNYINWSFSSCLLLIVVKVKNFPGNLIVWIISKLLSINVYDFNCPCSKAMALESCGLKITSHSISGLKYGLLWGIVLWVGLWCIYSIYHFAMEFCFFNKKKLLRYTIGARNECFICAH